MSNKKPRTPLAQGILTWNDAAYDSSRNSPSPSLDLQTTPRETTPTKSNLVRRPDYSSELSISDIENEVKRFQKQANPTRRFSPVIQEILSTEVHVDDENFNKGGEVSTKTIKINSPARVICHSPSSHRDRSVPRRDRSNGDRERSTTSTTQHKSQKSLSFGQELDEKPKTKKADLSDTKQKKNKSTDSIHTKEHPDSGMKKKKKKYIVVESRFKQQQQQPTSKKDETLKSRSLELSAITPHPGIHQTKHNSQKKSRVTSTPFLTTSTYEGQAGTAAGIDGSILDQTRFQTAQPTVKEPPIKQPLMKKGKLKRDKESGSNLHKKEASTRLKDTSRESNKENKGTLESEQLMVDLNYARKLQQTYLDMRARQTFEKQEEKAKDQIYAMWALNRKLEKEIEALTLTVKTGTMEMAIDQLLNIQMEGIKPLGGNLSKLIIKSSRLSQALSNTTHYLNLKNITVGDEGVLLKALDESKRLLAEITALTRREQPQIEELSMSSEVLMKTTKNELQQQAQCYELLGACSSLMNQELSLQAQVLQSK